MPPGAPASGFRRRATAARRGAPASRPDHPPPATRSWPATASQAIVVGALLASVAYAVLIGQHIQASLGSPTDILYTTGTQQILVTTFLRVAVAAVACWLVALRPRAGYVVAVAFGAVTLILFAVGYLQPTDPGPRLAPAWLQSMGVLASVAMVIASGDALRRRKAAGRAGLPQVRR